MFKKWFDLPDVNQFFVVHENHFIFFSKKTFGFVNRLGIDTVHKTYGSVWVNQYFSPQTLVKISACKYNNIVEA